VSTGEDRSAELLAARRAGPVVVVPYDAAWPARFAALRDRLHSIVGDAAIAIEHEGSTAVAGLAARPIIDVTIVVRAPAELPDIIARLAASGYVHVGDLGITGREAFLARDESDELHNLAVSPVGAVELQRHLTFRDALIANAELADRYARLKLELAAAYPHDLDGYIEGKTGFIKTVIADARNDSRSRKR
jgi:GrpB-like predicted nucleotidyltransferase (UPF0157 family)